MHLHDAMGNLDAEESRLLSLVASLNISTEEREALRSRAARVVSASTAVAVEAERLRRRSADWEALGSLGRRSEDCEHCPFRRLSGEERAAYRPDDDDAVLAELSFTPEEVDAQARILGAVLSLLGWLAEQDDDGDCFTDVVRQVSVSDLGALIVGIPLAHLRRALVKLEAALDGHLCRHCQARPYRRRNHLCDACDTYRRKHAGELPPQKVIDARFEASQPRLPTQAARRPRR